MLDREHRLQVLFDGIDDAVFVLDEQGHVLDCNDAACRRLGYPRDELLHLTARDLDAPGATPSFTERLQQQFQHQRFSCEGVQMTRDGRHIPVDIRSSRIEYEGRPAVLAVVRDMRSYHESEQRLAWQSRTHAALAELAQAILARTNVSFDDLSQMVLNHACELTDSAFGYVGYIDPTTGYLVCPTMTRDIWDACNVADKSITFKEFGGLWGWVLDNHRPLLTNAPAQDQRSTGTPAGHLPIQRFLSAPALVDDQLVGQIALANADRDYTDDDLELVQRLANLYAIAIHESRSRQRLREDEHKYRTLFESSADGVLIMTDVFLDCNAALCRMWGCSREEIIGRSPADFSPPTQPDGRPSMEAAEERVRTALSGVPVFFSWQHRRADGTLIDCEIALVAIMLHGRRVLQATVRDMTQRKRNEERIAHLNAVLLAIRNVNQLICREHDPERLIEQTCALLVETRGYRSAWLALLDRDTHCTTFKHIGLGPPGDVLADRLRTNGLPPCAQRALQTPGIIALRDPTTLCDECVVREIGPDVGVLTTRLEHDGKVHGVLTVTVPAPLLEDETEQSLFTEVAGDVAFALSSIATLNERERSRTALHRSEELLRKVVERIPTGVWVGDRELNVRLWNAGMEQITGTARSDILGHNMLERFPSLIEHGLDEHYRRVIATGEPLRLRNIPYRDPALPRSQYYVNVTAEALRESDGTTSGIVVAIEDITDRTRAEQALRESEARHRIVTEMISDYVYSGTLHADGFAETNWIAGAIERISGYTLPEIQAHPGGWFGIALPEGLERFKQSLPRLLGNEPVVIEYRIRAKDGTIRWLRDYIKPVWSDTDARVTGLLGAVQDMTAQREIEVALRTSEERHRTLFDTSRDGIVYASVDGHIEEANPAFCEMLGYTLDELRQLRYQDFTPSKWAEFEREMVTEHILKHGHKRFEKEYIHKDGRVFPVTVDAWCVRDKDGQPARMFGVVRDISEQKQAEAERDKLEAQLRRSQKLEAVGQLAGGVAHDFNNILTAILGSAELLREQVTTLAPPARDLTPHVDQIERAAHRAASLTRQMLAFSRRQTVQPQLINLNAIVTDTERMLRRLITENISLEMRLHDRIPPLLADAGQVEQVVMNLVINARDAMPDGGHLVVETSTRHLDDNYVATHPDAQPGEHVLLQVSDTGCGMSPDTLERIFEPFFTTKPTGQGTGLGLATAYGIVKQLGGHISVYSEVNTGTTFNVYLPRAPEAVARSAAPAADTIAEHGSATVLVCEDDPSVRQLAVKFLESAGYRVVGAGSGTEAVALADQLDVAIDLLLTDVIMPDMNGRELSLQLTRRFPKLRTLFMSGYTANVIAHHGVIDPGIALLEKPFSRETLLRAVAGGLATEAGD